METIREAFWGFINNVVYIAHYLIVGKYLFRFSSANRKYRILITIGTLLLTTILWIRLGVLSRLVLHMVCVLIVLVVFFKER